MAREARGALGAGVLGLALIVLAGLFDAEPLYVPGIALLALALIAVAWVRSAAGGTQVMRTLGAARVQEDEPLLVEIEVRGGRVAPPAGEIRDVLLPRPAPLTAGRARTRVRITARFGRRGLRVLPAPTVLVSDPLGLASAEIAAAGPADEVLVLPRIEPVRSPPGGAGRGRETGALRGAGAEADLDGLRVHRPGAPASRIAWQVYARSGELHERRLRDGGDLRPLVVLDLGGTSVADDVDAAVRAAASLTVHLAAGGGCALLLPGERRPLAIDAGMRAWPAAHARLALVPAGGRPVPAALSGRAGALIWVAARSVREPPRALVQASGAARVLVVPGSLAGRDPAFVVGGCTGYALGARSRVRRPRVAVPGR